MSSSVSATGMKVQAQAESGIVIKNVTGNTSTDWGTSASAQHSTAIQLVPTSTADCTTWYHATSRYLDSADTAQSSDGAYTNVDTITGTRSDTYTSSYYACYQFNIKVASGSALSVASLDVNSVSVTAPTTSQSPNLNKSMRVGIVMVNNSGLGTLAGIYAPVYGTEDTIDLTKINNTTNITAIKGSVASKNANINTIPNSDDALKVFVYIWFEGEDPHCKSTNITAALDELVVNIQFGYTEPTQQGG